MAEEPVAMAVVCRSCVVNVWQGNEPVEENGQTLLTAYADSTCKVAGCPNTTAAQTELSKHRTATQKDIEALSKRLAKLEEKSR